MEQLTSLRDNQIADLVGRLMAGEAWLSYTSLMNFLSSPSDFIQYKLREKVETEAMIYGSMVHCLVLEPEDFDNRYFTFDDAQKIAEIGGEKPRATKAYKEWRTLEHAKAGDKIIVTPDDFANAKAVATNVRNNRASKKILTRCPVHEKPIDWEFMNFKFRGLIDGDGEETTLDLKTMPDADPRKVEREIVSRGLHIQAAMYSFGNDRPKKHHIIAVDKLGGVSVHQIHDSLMAEGMKEYTRLVGRFNECILSEAWDQSHDFWAERADGIYTAEKPGWMY